MDKSMNSSEYKFYYNQKDIILKKFKKPTEIETILKEKNPVTVDHVKKNITIDLTKKNSL